MRAHDYDDHHRSTISRSSLLPAGLVMRPAQLDDADALCVALAINRDYLRPWHPRRAERFYTPAGQADYLASCAAERRSGSKLLWVLRCEHGIDGTVALYDIVHADFSSSRLSYWVGYRHAGQGAARAAVAHACKVASEVLRLHRVEAIVDTENLASQKVLKSSGFELIGTAKKYYFARGAWRDHFIFQLILNDLSP